MSMHLGARLASHLFNRAQYGENWDALLKHVWDAELRGQRASRSPGVTPATLQ